jgi:RNA-directed DNA polymerase
LVPLLPKPHEEDFLGFSYGFRPGRSQHDALDALTVALKSQKVNWILDADITSFFDEIDHEWMLMFLGHRIADRRLLGLIGKWLQAGVMENGRRVAATKGTPQGAVISPLLANIYLHYVLDLWARQWRHRHARGDMVVVRYADDSVVGFRKQSQAQQFLAQLQERLARFGLSLNAAKTRLIEFGRFAIGKRRRRGLGKPETFDFLGFTHCCSTKRNGDFQVLRLTVKKRMRATLLAIRDELQRRRHELVRAQGQWLNRVVGGYFNYHAVPGNLLRLDGFRAAVCRLWRQALKRRSQRNRLQWSRFGRLADLYIPKPRTAHPYPEERFASRT